MKLMIFAWGPFGAHLHKKSQIYSSKWAWEHRVCVRTQELLKVNELLGIPGAHLHKKSQLSQSK
jgi:hypothetical protein